MQHHVCAPPPILQPSGPILQAAGAHLRDHHNRLSHQHHSHHPHQQQHNHHTQSMHSSTQMQKIRQEHQHLNNNNNSNNNNNNNTNNNKNNNTINKINYHQQYNALQQQKHQSSHMVSKSIQSRNQLPHHHSQQLKPPYHMPHMKNHHQSTNNANHLSKSVQHHQPPLANLNDPSVLPATPTPLPPTKHFYNNNNNNNNNMTNVNSTKQQQLQQPIDQAKYNVINLNLNNIPKTILQNSNRSVKSRMQATANAIVPSDDLTVTAIPNVSGNITLTPDIQSSATPIVNANTTDVHSSQSTENESRKADITAFDALADGEEMVADSPTIPNALVSLSANNKSDDGSNESDMSIKNNNNNNSNNNANVGDILKATVDDTKKSSKEKTPMCLVNELARFNKITHQYRLTNEMGPAHCKRFTVTLKLGDEEYSAEGFKIKKAQHLAASEAIQKTKYKHPIPKTNRRGEHGHGSNMNITPTVELNALAMKLGQQTYYLFDPCQVTPVDESGPQPPDGLMSPFSSGSHCGHIIPPGPPPPPLSSHHNPRNLEQSYLRRKSTPPVYAPSPYSQTHPRYCQRGYPPKYPLHNQPQHRYPMMPPPPAPLGVHNGINATPVHPHRVYAPAPTPCQITLIVGKQKFTGIGKTVQHAKHDAAARALQVLKAQAASQMNEMLNNSLEESDSKSPISLVHEIGIKRNMSVHFKVLREEGPAHMKNFITACIVGSIVTEGEGNGKKISKKRAAEKMLEELKLLPPLSITKSPVKRIRVKTPSKSGGSTTGSGPSAADRRKRTGVSIKEKAETEQQEEENPITRLIQLQQTRKEKEPVFELIAKSGNEISRRREFIVEVTAQGMVARGMGSSKKLAKRNAAQNLLTAMGINEAAGEQKSQTETGKTTEVTTTESSIMDEGPDNNSTTLLSKVGSTKPNPVEEGISTAKASEKVNVPLVTTSAGQVPGILILRQNRKNAAKKKELATTVSNTSEPDDKAIKSTTNATQQTSKIAVATPTPKAQIAITTSIPSTDSENTNQTTASKSNAKSSSGSSLGVHMKDQLLYLAKLMGFEVQFSDYPKGNHNEYLTIVTLSTSPPQICHGVGISAEESQNDAARNALKILSELGLNSAS